MPCHVFQTVVLAKPTGDKIVSSLSILLILGERGSKNNGDCNEDDNASYEGNDDDNSCGMPGACHIRNQGYEKNEI